MRTQRSLSKVNEGFDYFIDYNNNANQTKCIREVRVKCLQSLEDLKRICEKLGLKFDYYSEETMLVDMILDDMILENQRLYLIKWQGYDSAHSSWEPVEGLINCEDMIYFYDTMKNPPSILNEEMIFCFIKDLLTRKPYDYLTLTKLCALIFKLDEKYINSLKLSFADLRKKASKILNIPTAKLNKINDELLNLMQFSEKRKLVLLSLHEWEIKINKNNFSPYVKIENNVDLEGPPMDFNFISDCISSYVDLTPHALVYCTCKDCGKNRNGCCAHYFDDQFAYDKHRRLQLPPGYPIYECNDRCKCDKNCINRVVQCGQKIRVCIFRTSNGCGWGLKTLDPIEKGQFALEYTGEVITSNHAEERAEVYDHLGRTYLFDLDYEEDCLYTVDSMLYGNASRFINHSCNPNLETYSVWANQQDPNLPKIAFFARKKIYRGEELTFDYKMEDSRNTKGVSDLEKERILCMCNSRNCKKYLV
ncbi:histone-lysine N-methyltransferase SUV39H2 [Trichonephila clavata]|uniref:Histone-lysine N-methyltransferase n=1 Tax=Trichonephila clavata TaxID=2740835 RepID=A0A8X6KLM4_TRICU|nr:histone-lysine N-methyltransferase SUV39H2 [Trichonephila clavata]